MLGEKFTTNDITYEVEESFNHYYTNEELYRVKRRYSSGGLDFIVLNEEELNELKEGPQV